MTVTEISILIDQGWLHDEEDDVLTKNCGQVYCMISPASAHSKLYVDGQAHGAPVETALDVSTKLEALDLVESLLNENYDRTSRGLAHAFMESPLYAELASDAKQAFAHNEVSGSNGFFSNNDFDIAGSIQHVEQSLASGSLKMKLDPKLRLALPNAIAAFKDYLTRKGVRRPEMASRRRIEANVMENIVFEDLNKIYKTRVQVQLNNITAPDSTDLNPDDLNFSGLDKAILDWKIDLISSDSGVEEIQIVPLNLAGIAADLEGQPIAVEVDLSSAAINQQGSVSSGIQIGTVEVDALLHLNKKVTLKIVEITVNGDSL